MLPRGTLLVRIYGPGRSWSERRARGPHPEARFDHHRPPPGSGKDRGVWYASRSLLGAVAESFGGRGFLDREAGDRVVLARLSVPIRLVDLVGVAARRFALTQEIASTPDYEETQRWARALYERYPTLAGLRWRGRQGGSISVVLTDRAPMARLSREVDLPIADPRVWPRIARAANRCQIAVI